MNTDTHGFVVGPDRWAGRAFVGRIDRRLWRRRVRSARTGAMSAGANLARNEGGCAALISRDFRWFESVFIRVHPWLNWFGRSEAALRPFTAKSA